MMKRILIIISLILAVIICLLSMFSASAPVTDIKTPPISSNEVNLKWSVKLGKGYMDAPSVPAVSDGNVYVMSRNTLYRINCENGEIINSTTMADEPSFSYTPVLIKNGIIFCPLENGTIQAFDSETMQSLWIYKDSLGGQSLTPIVYYDGYIYTGFWNDEEINANFVCINAQTGKLEWSYAHIGGFYWAECYVNDNYVIVGGDNGKGDDYSAGVLHCLNRLTGKLTDTAKIIGDQRSGITHYNDSLYFVTKAGYLYRVSVNSSGELSDIRSTKLTGASTSTPTVYNGRVYVGVQSKGFGGNISVVDSETLNLIYDVPMNGYPQSEFLLSNAYEAETGKVYVYSTYNAAPGGITVITDSKGQTQPVCEQLYVPESDKQSYCISPVFVDSDKTLYYKNDSGNVFAIERKADEPQKEKTFFDYIIYFFAFILNLILSLVS